MTAMRAHFILYVRDQGRSARFYEEVLGCKPALDVPGMTEFALDGECVLGLMPEEGIQRLLGGKLPALEGARGGPRAEVYLLVDDPRSFHARALGRGARELSALAVRDWGHETAYSLDPDGHVLAFARALPVPPAPRC